MSFSVKYKRGSVVLNPFDSRQNEAYLLKAPATVLLDSLIVSGTSQDCSLSLFINRDGYIDEERTVESDRTINPALVGSFSSLNLPSLSLYDLLKGSVIYMEPGDFLSVISGARTPGKIVLNYNYRLLD